MSNEAANKDERESNPESSQAAVYVMSVAAELVGTHPQTLREYERRGFISPKRTDGGNRRYTHADIEKVLRVKRLRDEGMSLTAIASLMEYEEAIYILSQENEKLKNELSKTQHRLGNVEKRLYEVESTVAENSRALVKTQTRDVVLVVRENEQEPENKSEKRNKE